MEVIAELCQNHNGDFELLLKMVDAAAESGATHVKIQHIYAKNLVYRPEFEMGLEQGGALKAFCRPWQKEYDRLKELELTDDECCRFVEYSRSLGLIPMTTCFSRGDVERIYQQGFRVVKVASYDCASFTLLRELSARFDYLYVSTGSTFDDELDHAAKILIQNARGFSLLHCVTQYPTPLEAMNLNRIEWLKQYCSNVGFSDHSLVSRDGILAAKAAIACGADIVERHFTILDPSLSKDGPVSVTREHIRALKDFSNLSTDDQFAQLSEEFPNWKLMLGESERWLSDEEILNRNYYRGRFGTARRKGLHRSAEMIFNWDETPI